MAAAKKLEEAVGLLEQVLVLLTDKERSTVPRVRSDFPEAGRQLAKESAEHADLVALTEYDAEAVVEDLDNVEALGELEKPLSRLKQLIDDSRLLWLAEAYLPTLSIYGVAKVFAKKDAKLARAIEPLADLLSTPRKKGPKGEG
jgi:hypothetical protein